MKHFFYLSTCDTCKRIMSQLQLPDNVTLQDIKVAPLSRKQIEQLHQLAGSYEALFSKRARLYKERNLKEQHLTEEDFKALLLEHYTFLKRPVLLWDDQLFIGNTKKVVEAAQNAITQ